MAISPMTVATTQAAAPTPRPIRALAAATIHPIKGPPIGVVP
jgi:hypothetical protein